MQRKIICFVVVCSFSLVGCSEKFKGKKPTIETTREDFKKCLSEAFDERVIKNTITIQTKWHNIINDSSKNNDEKPNFSLVMKELFEMNKEFTNDFIISDHFSIPVKQSDFRNNTESYYVSENVVTPVLCGYNPEGTTIIRSALQFSGMWDYEIELPDNPSTEQLLDYAKSVSDKAYFLEKVIEKHYEMQTSITKLTYKYFKSPGYRLEVTYRGFNDGTDEFIWNSEGYLVYISGDFASQGCSLSWSNT